MDTVELFVFSRFFYINYREPPAYFEWLLYCVFHEIKITAKLQTVKWNVEENEIKHDIFEFRLVSSFLNCIFMLYRRKSITFWTVYSAKIECMRTEARHFLLDAGIQIIFSSGFGNCFELNWLFLFSVLQDNLGVCDGPGQPRLSGKPAGYLYPVQVSRLGYKHRFQSPDTIEKR